MLLVLGETGTEFLAEKGFLAAGFYIKGKPDDNHGEERADFAESDGGAKKREQNAGVNGMANHSVGAGTDELVPFLERDNAAPVCAEMPARPKRDADSGGGQQNAKPFAEGASGKKAIAQPAVVSLRPGEKIKPHYEWKHVGKTLEPGFTLLGFLPLQSGYKPIDTKKEPQRFNPLAGGRKIHIAVQNAAGRKMKQLDRCRV